MDELCKAILESLGFGYENARTRRDLCLALNVTDRDLRRAIEVLRRDYPIINRDDGAGYYRPAHNLEGLIDMTIWLAKQTHRIESIRASQEGAIKKINELKE